jgi:biopolymer transport protein ExbD
MSMSAGDSNTGLTNEPNVTPMIDVLLVLLIIFMMVIPMSRKAIDTMLPDPNPVQQPPNSTPPDQIVLEVLPNGQFALNKNPIQKDALFNRLKDTYNGRPDKIIFIKGDTAVQYKDVIFAMDQARGAGVLVIGVPPKDN